MRENGDTMRDGVKHTRDNSHVLVAVFIIRPRRFEIEMSSLIKNVV